MDSQSTESKCCDQSYFLWPVQYKTPQPRYRHDPHEDIGKDTDDSQTVCLNPSVETMTTLDGLIPEKLDGMTIEYGNEKSSDTP